MTNIFILESIYSNLIVGKLMLKKQNCNYFCKTKSILAVTLHLLRFRMRIMIKLYSCIIGNLIVNAK